jgi:hypothetical protein
MFQYRLLIEFYKMKEKRSLYKNDLLFKVLKRSQKAIFKMAGKWQILGLALYQARFCHGKGLSTEK